MLRQLASRAAASSSQLCGALSASSMALSCSTRAAVATEVFRCARRGAASNDCDGPRSLSPSPMIATSSGRSSSSTALDPSFVPSTSYSVTSSWGRPGAQMWTRVRDIGMRLNPTRFFDRRPRLKQKKLGLFSLSLFLILSLFQLSRPSRPRTTPPPEPASTRSFAPRDRCPLLLPRAQGRMSSPRRPPRPRRRPLLRQAPPPCPSSPPRSGSFAPGPS